MTFLHPAILAAGLLAVAIPILIHFFMRRRRRPIPWAAMRFLAEAYRKRKRRLALEQLLLLAARCLLVALLGAAIAHPLLGAARAGSEPPRLLIVLLDDSLTSRVTDDAGATELSRSIALAADAVGSLDPARGDRAAVVALSAPAHAIVGSPSADLPGVARAIESVTPTDAPADLPGAVALARAILERTEGTDAYVLIASGLHAGVLGGRPELGALAGEGSGPARVHVATPSPAAARPNTAIAALEPARRVLAGDTPGGRLVMARLARFGPDTPGQRTEVRLSDERTGRALGISSIAWNAGERERTVSVPIDPGADAPGDGQIVIRAEIGADALGADGIRRALVERRRSVRIGVVSAAPERALGVGVFSPADWVRAALEPEPGTGAFEVVTLDPARIGPGTTERLDALIVVDPGLVTPPGWRALRAFVDGTGPVVVAPPADAEAHVWADEMTGAFGTPWTVGSSAREPEAALALATDPPPDRSLLAPIATELEYLAPPVRVARALALTPGAGGRDAPGVALALADGTPFIVAHTPDGAAGVLVLLASAIDPGWTNLPTRPLFVPLMHELVRQGMGVSRGRWDAEAGAPAPAPRGAIELAPAFSLARAGAVPVSEPGVSAEPVRAAGAFIGLDTGGAPRGLVVVNPPSHASSTDRVPRAELDAWLAPLTPGEPVRWIERDAGADGTGAGADQTTIAGALVAERAGSPVAWIALAAALTLALLECALGRFGSHAERAGRGA